MPVVDLWNIDDDEIDQCHSVILDIGETVTNEVVSQRRFDTIILNYFWLQMVMKEKWV